MYGRVGVQTMSTKNSKYVEESFVPVKNINNGMIVLDNNLIVTGVKIQPKNIFILEPDVQFSIINNLKDVYNIIDYEFWIIAADRPVDIDVYLSQLEVHYNSIQDPIRRKMIREDIGKANMFMNNNVVDTEYFILFKEKDSEIAQKKIRSLISNLANSGLNAVQTSNEDLRIVLDNFLNGGQTTGFGTVLS
jgi:hypothetical protein